MSTDGVKARNANGKLERRTTGTARRLSAENRVCCCGPEGCCVYTKHVYAQGRIGIDGSGDFEMDVGFVSSAPVDRDHLNGALFWANGVAKAFSVTRVGGVWTITIDGVSATFSPGTPHADNKVIILEAHASNAANTVVLTGLTYSGIGAAGTRPAAMTTTDTEYYVQCLGYAEGDFTVNGYVTMNWVGATPERSQLWFQVASGNCCDPCGDCQYPRDMAVYETYDGYTSKHHYTLDITLKLEMFLESSDCSGTPTFIAGGVPYPFGTGNYYGGSTTNYYAPPNTDVIGPGNISDTFPILDNSEAVRVDWLYRNCDNNTWHIIFDAERQGWVGIEQVYNFIRRLACEIPPESAISGGIAGGSYFDVELEGDCEGTEVDITCCSGPGYYPGVNGVPPVPDPPQGVGYIFYSSARATMTIKLTNNWKESCP